MANGITESDVWKAADALLLEGQRPTIERVRQQIGRGSPNTVQPYLDTWFKGLGARIRDPQAFAASAAIPEPVTRAADFLWQAAQAEARANLKKDQDQLDLVRQALEQERQAFHRKEAELTARLEAVASAFETATNQLEEARQREVMLLTTGKELDRRYAEAAAALTASRAQLDATRAEFDRERQENTEQARLQEQHWLQEIDRQRQASKDAAQRTSAIEKRAQSTIQTLEARVLTAETLALGRQAEIDALRTAQAEQARLIMATEHSLALAQAKLDAAQVSVDVPRRRIQTATMSSLRPKSKFKRANR
jgi:chromosome segregation ATPase